MEKLGLEEGQELEARLVESFHRTGAETGGAAQFQEIRKRTLEYDDVMNKQREVLYGFRNEVIHTDDPRDRLMDIMEEDGRPESGGIHRGVAGTPRMAGAKPRGVGEPEFSAGRAGGGNSQGSRGRHEEPVRGSLFDGLSAAQFGVFNFISDAVRKAYELKISFEQPDALKAIERYTILSAIDKLWQELYLYEMDSLRASIGLRAHGQRDPLIEYKAEAYTIFEALMVNIKTEICHNIFRSASSLAAFQLIPLKHSAKDDASGAAIRAWNRRTSSEAWRQRHGKRSGRGNGQAQAGAHRTKGRPQRPVPLWQREEIHKQCCGK